MKIHKLSVINISWTTVVMIFGAMVILQVVQSKNSVALGGDTTIENVGFQGPESVFFDKKSDTYLVSNVNGAPTLKDDNGFISRVSPDGRVTDLKWIDGASSQFTLNAPKGITISRGKLYVTDIDNLRVFDAATGAYQTSYEVAGAGFLNDVVAAPNGDIYFSDTGIGGSPVPAGGDAIYKLSGDTITKFAAGTQLSAPNGLEFHDQIITMVPQGSDKVFEFSAATGAMTTKAQLPQGGLDGVIRLDDGTLFVSSWNGSSVYRLAPSGAITTEVAGVVSPADIEIDSGRNRLLIPLLTLDKIVIHTLN